MPGTLTILSKQRSIYFALVLFNLQNVELLLNDEYKTDIGDSFCRSLNGSARNTRRGSEFCSCVETVSTIGRFYLKKCVYLHITKL